ncbi:glucose-1-phosphate cytidylyltransferase [candidate division WOR-3 bacterium]|nr:glucose-1-phosphate cytidylyltransferase [candidate division WOR-3 bacterium]
MKVVILAGGFGTRLGNRTNLIPKPMVKIGNKPILWHIMKIYAHYGFNEFIICLGNKGEVIKDYFLHYKARNNDFTIDVGKSNIEFHNDHVNNDWKVTLVDTGINTKKGGRIKRVEKYLDDDINLLTYGDGVADIDINELVKFHKNHDEIITITGVHPPSRFGELLEEDGIVKTFTEKPQTSQGLINGGFMVFDYDFLDYLTPDVDCDLEIGALKQLSHRGEVMVFKHKGKWECMDHERDVQHLNKLWEENKAFWKVWE